MFEQTENPEPQKPTDWSGAIIGFALLPVFFIFMHVGKQDLGLGVCVCLMGILLAVKLRWDLRTKPWFWGVVVLVLALNMPLIVMVKWPHGWLPAGSLLPIAIADCLVTLGAARSIEKYLVRTTSRITPE